MTWYNNSEGRYGKSGAKGDAGEDVVKSYCINHNIRWEDMNDYKSQVIDKIDCIVEGVPVDVKTNINKNNQCVVELALNNKKKRGPGWLYETRAEQIYAVDLAQRRIFVYNIFDMKAYVSKNKHKAYKVYQDEGTNILMYVSLKENFITEIT